MMTVSSSPSLHAAVAFPSLVLPVGVGVALHAARSLFPTLVRSRNFPETDLSPKIVRISSSFPRISLRLDSRQTAAFRRRLEPVQARRRCPSEIDLAFYPEAFAYALELLRTLPDVRARCRQIESYGKELPSVLPNFVPVASRVEGLPASYNTCVRARLDPADRSLVIFDFRSAAAHIRGLAAILTAGLSGSPVRAVANMSLAPFSLLIVQSLLPARWCSHFMLLLEHMQRKARELITSYVDYNTNVNDVLSIMGLGSLHISLKDEIEASHVVHELLNDDDDGDRDDDVHVDREGEKCDEDSFYNDREGGKYDEDSFDNEHDGPSWRVKRYPPEDIYFYDLYDEDNSVASSTPLRWG